MSCTESGSFALQVIGDSMEPEFKDGAIVIVEPGATVENACFVIAERHDEYILRQLKYLEEGWQLVTLDGQEEAVHIDSLRCIKGRVIQRTSRRRKDHKWYV